MAKIKSRKHLGTTQLVALAATLPLAAHAAPAEDNVAKLPTIEVNAENNYKAESTSTKRTESLLNTAKTTQIITAQSLKEQNLLSLQDALATTPGISFGAGEGGGGYGDKINLRGYDAQSNITIDGLRDAAVQTRSDLFNYEAVEITKGANSSESGVGQVSGGINLASKAPKNRDFNEVTVGKGSDDYTRITGDFNKVLSDDVAVRLNVMNHQDTYVGRPEERKRWGYAPSITVGINDTTQATLSYFHQEDDNDPLYGVPYYNGKAVPGISTANNYGYRNLDNQTSDTDITTLKVTSAISDMFTLNSITRFSDITQDMVVTAPQGTYCLANGLSPTGFTNDNQTGYTDANCGKKGIIGQYIPSGPRGYHRETNTKQFSNDTNLISKFKTGILEHALVTGVSYSTEDYALNVGGYLYNSNGTPLAKPNMDVYHPDNYWHGETNYFANSTGLGKLDIYSAYLFDTIKLGSQFLVNAGVRFDRTEGQYATTSRDSVTADDVKKDPTLVQGTLKNTWTTNPATSQDNNLVSYNLGLTYKPTESTSLYATYANAQKPTQNSANAGCTTGTTCDTKPEEAVNYELGAKWQMNPNFLINAAVFRNEQNKVRVASAIAGMNNVLDGKNHVDGVEIGAAGNITPQWGISASLAYMKGEYDQTIASAATATDFAKGAKMTNVPELSGGLWTTYQFNDQWQVGYGLTYQGKMYLSSVTATTNLIPQVQSEDYLIHNASITYSYNKDLSFQLIGKNLSDKEYYARIRNNGWATPGEGRQGVFNVNYKF
ncbi:MULTISPECIES: TonB-dependent receptor [Acinetobacter]|uniref:TonB-dependent receptor n=1 Tax=Acinetobacter corruptisaponis TaxID=3045147 RepID=A0ABY8S137_9GAMM|nr:TonB-dependent receptor [Acinetobacter sp. KCTC 92772]WHP05026.1 TonB-dependent receptor [Acinetobacter sp. KCTC 92772]